jgi:hypothetical protein
MTSQINPNNVNTAYPVAGQDNSTQGFRDNFTNIKLNFTYAAAEITALQNVVAFNDTYFDTFAGPEATTLSAGVNGQVRVFAMGNYGGNMVVTVANPAWGGAGTMTFSAVGIACTLKYINNKWFCIGNNGCTFA